MASPRHPLQEGSFDPLALLHRSREGGGSESRITMLRMLWLRQRIPDARVETSLVSIDDRAVVMSATISLPDGGQGSGHSAAPIEADANLAEAVESAETQAIGRALDVLGYVVAESASSSASPDRPSAASSPPDPQPVRRSDPPGHVQAIRQMKNRDQSDSRPPHEPAPVGPYREVQEAATEEPASRAEPSPPPEPPAPGVPQEPPPDESDEPELEDISWTAFWRWARSTYQLTSKGQLEELLSQPVGNKNPGQLRQLLDTHFAEDPDDES